MSYVNANNHSHKCYTDLRFSRSIDCLQHKKCRFTEKAGCTVLVHSAVTILTRSQAVARIADRSAKNCMVHVT